MLRSGAPTQLTQVFAGGSGAGPTNVVPLTPTGSQPAGQIAYSTGFTSTNMTPIASGGVAPWGADMNGLLKAQTQAQIYQQAGFLYPYSSAFSTAMSGYPAGAVLPMASGLGLWLNQTDGNTTDPDSSGASGWVPQPANQGVTALTGLTGGTAVLTPNQLGAPFITLAGTLTSNLQVTLPLSAGRTYTIQNNTTGAYTVTVAGATGTGVTISQGTANGTTVYTDGTNWYTGQFNGAGVYLPINGTAVAATKLATARTIAMTGDVSWTSPAFDGTANVTAAGTIAAGAVSLAKMANFQANSLMGNPTGSASTPSAITLQNGLVFSGSNLGLGIITPSGVVASGSISVTGATSSVSAGGMAIYGTNSGVGTNSSLLNFYANRWLDYNISGDYYHFNSAKLAIDGALTVAGAFTATTAVSTIGAIAGNSTIYSTAAASLDVADTVASPALAPTIMDQASAVNNGGTLCFGASGTERFAYIKGIFTNGGTNGTGQLVFGTRTNTTDTSMTHKMTLSENGTLALVGNITAASATISGGLTATGAVSTGSATVNGNLVVTGTVNFATSDATLKDLGTPVEPRPFHRVPYYAYTRRDTGEHGWGPTAQAVATIAPEYTRTQCLSVNGDDRDVLLLAKEQITMDTAFWAGRQVDLLWEEIADLRRQLADARAH